MGYKGGRRGDCKAIQRATTQHLTPSLVQVYSKFDKTGFF